MKLNCTKFSEWGESVCFLDPWVIENVVPKLLQTGIPNEIIKARLGLYLSQFDDEVIVYADWPLDFYHMCNLLIDDSKETMPIKLVKNLTMKLITTPDTYTSKIPHNALKDAEALHLNHKEMK